MHKQIHDGHVAQGGLASLTCRMSDYREPSKSQRLRFTLYRLWERSESHQPFEEWYHDRMDRIITQFQKLLT